VCFNTLGSPGFSSEGLHIEKKELWLDLLRRHRKTWLMTLSSDINPTSPEHQL
ncbi:hypothetical protein STEG23_029007, partial [Scotinomys teguina]